MANVGTGTSGKVLTATGLTSSSSFQAIGTFSGLTDNGVIIGGGAGPFTATAALTNGQLVIGSTGVDPVAASLTAGTGVTIIPGAGSISISVNSTVGQTITGDSGGALVPTAGNWNILGGPGVTTSGSGSTLTINSVVYTDQAVQFTATSDSGSFMTNAGNIILDLPLVPLQGQLIEIACTTAFLVAVDAPAGDFIRIGSLITSSGGTATSTLIGDSLSLRFSNSDQTWYATSVVGTWVMA